MTADSTRSATAKRNRAKRKGITLEGREKLRATALQNQPWRFSTGPRTAAGKSRVARNGKRRQIGARSVRELRTDLAELKQMASALRAHRHSMLSQ